MCLVSAAVANGGTIMAPHVLQSITDDAGTVVERAQPQVWKQALNAAQASQVRDMMVGVVERGTATSARLPGIQVAAKTGTAQTVGNNAHAWMTAFAPADAPRVAVAVIIESQPGLGDVTGGRTAGPVVRAVLQAALNADPT